jgi:cysteine desulfurase family protein
MIYLDNASTTGTKPNSVISAVEHALKYYSANPGRSGHSPSMKAEMMIFGCRKRIMEFFNADSENNVCFTLNCTQAINTVMYGVLGPRDHVIISSLEHNAVLRSVHRMHIEFGVQYSIAEVDLYDDDKTVENFKRNIRKNTKLMFVTAASNVLGKKLPLQKLGNLCLDNDILFAVDAAQGAGHLKLDMKAMHIDYLCLSGHKGLYGPMGIGVLITNKNIDKVLVVGGTGVNSIEFVQPYDLPERLESGTVNVSGIAGLGAGIEFVKNVGLKKISVIENDVCQIINTGLKKIGSEMYMQYDSTNCVPVLPFNIKNHSSEEIASYLNKQSIAVRGGIHCSPLAHMQLKTTDRGAVRVSPSYFNNVNEAERLIFVLKRII